MPQGAIRNPVDVLSLGVARDVLRKTRQETRDDAGKLMVALAGIVIDFRADEEWVARAKRCCSRVPTGLEWITKNGGKHIMGKPRKAGSAVRRGK